MATTLRMDGLKEFYGYLRQLPDELKGEADAIVRLQAEDAKRSIQQGYPEGPTGNLKARVSVEHNSSKWGTNAIVRSRAPHAWMFENGTRERKTSRGFNRGRMPKADEAEAFIPKAIRYRRRMIEALKTVLVKAGFEVH